MNARQAKKIGCYPQDPSRKPRETTPYTDAQIIESDRVYRRALERGDREGRVKWSSVRPTVWRAQWRPGYTSVRHYGPKTQRV